MRVCSQIQILSCICHVAAIINRDFQQLAQLIDLIADIVFFSTAGCMTAQVDYEIKYRESLMGDQMAPGGVVNPVSIGGKVGGAGPAPEGMDR